MRIRRSIRQCRMSASQASCSFWVQAIDPPSQAPFITRQPGVGICCRSGRKPESWAESVPTIASTTATRKEAMRDFMGALLRTAQYKTFQRNSLTVPGDHQGGRVESLHPNELDSRSMKCRGRSELRLAAAENPERGSEST